MTYATTRRLLLVASTALATALVAAATANADTLINFDNLAGSTPTSVTTQYAAQGVTFGNGPAGKAAVPPRAYANGAARSAPNLALIGFTPEAGTPHSDLWA